MFDINPAPLSSLPLSLCSLQTSRNHHGGIMLYLTYRSNVNECCRLDISLVFSGDSRRRQLRVHKIQGNLESLLKFSGIWLPSSILACQRPRAPGNWRDVEFSLRSPPPLPIPHLPPFPWRPSTQRTVFLSFGLHRKPRHFIDLALYWVNMVMLVFQVYKSKALGLRDVVRDLGAYLN